MMRVCVCSCVVPWSRASVLLYCSRQEGTLDLRHVSLLILAKILPNLWLILRNRRWKDLNVLECVWSLGSVYCWWSPTNVWKNPKWKEVQVVPIVQCLPEHWALLVLLVTPPGSSSRGLRHVPTHKSFVPGPLEVKQLSFMPYEVELFWSSSNFDLTFI